ncbi:exocyst complex subunit 6 [Dictyostelium discoideum AX4]|uniref:Exocyst complex component 6 n=1 Tax=Dictyostelium discoideum TaxID=44689 RepID=EXOC6_DICDI|nr:exocyst complex subunit 6 [Dictyostelium discoideum AX4]Q54B27.1 RecName: Full=Exocyst complex component 6; AltName: Full=Exocyst complex component Sec15 [Dictyostelium discoideum]EAL60467.1 exocyst complex subunit 6 [Dictyostelium discoideum AX4]|eukprot:XP_628889.1 exocyst complex subunit 6 [Dictyostelium discoideum AX4]
MSNKKQKEEINTAGGSVILKTMVRDKDKEQKEEKREKKEKKRLEKKEAENVKKEKKKEKKELKKIGKAGRSGSITSDSSTHSGAQEFDSYGNDSNGGGGGLSASIDSNGLSSSGQPMQTRHLEKEVGEKQGIYSLSSQDRSSSLPHSSQDDQAKPLITESEIFSSESFLIAVSDTDHLGPAIKSVFENNKEKEVIKILNAYIAQKDLDIEKICGENHEGFINSVTAFLGLKGENLDLKQDVINLNYELQEIGRKYVTKAEELFAYKQIKDNIKRTKEVLNNCQYAILLGMKVDEYVQQKKYYQAIKNMDQLHNVYLKKLSDFQFARNMDYNIPVLKEKIKKLVKDEFNQWMVEIKEKSAVIGKLGMIQTSKKLLKEREINPLKIKTTFGENEQIWDKILDIPPIINSSSIGSLALYPTLNSPVTAPIYSPNSGKTPSSFGFNKQINEKDLKEDINQFSPFDESDIQFHPLYQCLFIHASIGQLEEFQAYYTLNRLLQFQLVIQPKESGQVWELFLQQILGYFMVESKVIDSTEPFLSKTTINDSWNSALVKVTSVLQELFTHCVDTQPLIAFKKFVLIFTNTMSFYSYHVQPLYYFLDTMKEKYCQFSIKEAVERFTIILERDSHCSLIIESLEEYKSLILANKLDILERQQLRQLQNSLNNNQFQFGDKNLNNNNNNDDDDDYFDEDENEDDKISKRLPKSFLFSKMVPQFYTLIKKFISEFYEFSDQLTENENFIIRSTDTLIKKINEVLYSYLTQSQAVPQVIQLVINLQHLISGCSFFKDYLNSLILGEDYQKNQSIVNETNKVILNSQNLLYTTKSHGEKLIIKLCEQKIEDLMSSAANIEWFPQNAIDDRPRDYIIDVCTFLEVTLPFISPLSQNLKEEFITKAFKNISESLFSLIYDDQLKKLNLQGVKSFDADLKYIETYVKEKANEKERTTTTSRNMVGYFVELRQLTNFLLSDNPEDFVDPKIKAKHYNLITNIPQLLNILNKYKEESKGFTTSKEIKDRNKKIADAIKKIKDSL